MQVISPIYSDGTNHFQFGGDLLGLIAFLVLEMCSSNFENGIGTTTPRFRGVVLFDHFTSAKFSLKATCSKETCSKKVLKYISNTLQVQIGRSFIDCPLELHKHPAFFQSHIDGWRGTWWAPLAPEQIVLHQQYPTTQEARKNLQKVQKHTFLILLLRSLSQVATIKALCWVTRETKQSSA